MSFNVFCNPQNVSVAGVAVAGVSKITISQRAKEFVAGGDEDFYPSVSHFYAHDISGELEFTDITQALLLNGLNGIMSFDVMNIVDESLRQVELSGCEFMCSVETVEHDAASLCIVKFLSTSLPVIES